MRFARAGELKPISGPLGGPPRGIGGHPMLSLDEVFQAGNRHLKSQDLAWHRAFRETGVAGVHSDLEPQTAARQTGVE